MTICSVPISNGLMNVEYTHGNRPIVFVHGFGGSLRSWDRVLSYIDTARLDGVLRYDLRDFGLSKSHSHAPYEHWEDLKAILDFLEIYQCDLVGVSLGGAIVQNFALNQPDRVSRMVLISPAVMGWEWSNKWLILWDNVLKLASHDLDEAKMVWADHPMFSSIMHCDTARSDFLEEISAYSGQHWLIGDSHRLIDVPDIERLSKLDNKVLIISGETDDEEMLTISDVLESIISQSTRITIKASGHMLHLEQPMKVATLLNKFIVSSKRQAKAR